MRISDINFFYINCKKDIEKNKLIHEQWDECCIYYNKIILQRWDAVHFEDYVYPYFTEFNVPDNSKIKDTISNIAVFKSHSNLWKYVWDNQIKYAFILEDDAIIPRTFLKDLENILDEGNPDEWDVLYFGILRMMAKKTKISNSFYKVLDTKGYNNGLHAYLIKQKTAGKFLKLISEIGPENQIDIFIRDRASQFNLWVYKDLLIKQDVDKFESTRLGRMVKDEFKNTFDEINVLE